MNKLSFKAFIVITFIFLFTPNESFSDSKILCISSSNGLKYTDNDASLIGSAFGRYVGFKKSNIRVIKGKYGTKSNIIKNINQMFANNVTEGDFIVLFLAGHGIIIDSEYFFIPELNKRNIDLGTIHKAMKNNLLISKHEIIKVLESIPTKNKLLILDTCFSGSLLKKVNVPKFYELPNARGIVVKMTHDAISKDYTKGVYDIGFTIITACKAGQKAQESRRFRNGILTHYLVKVLKNRSWEKGLFDAEYLCKNIRNLSKNDGWDQEALAYGGNFFKVRLKQDSFQTYVPY